MDQRPRSMIVNTGMCTKYMAIAAPLRAECNPISFAVKLSVSGPTAVVAMHNFLRSSVPVKKLTRLSEVTNLFIVSDGEASL